MIYNDRLKNSGDFLNNSSTFILNNSVCIGSFNWQSGFFTTYSKYT